MPEAAWRGGALPPGREVGRQVPWRPVWCPVLYELGLGSGEVLSTMVHIPVSGSCVR